MSITAIVPLKALHRSKQRLAGHLDDGERAALMARLFTHVVGVCAAASAITDVCAVVGDEHGAALARGAGVTWLREPTAELNAAVAHATDRISGDASLVVVADLPRLTVTDIDRVAAAGAVGPAVVVARTHDGGTGALLRRPADVIEPAFGPASAAAHLAAGQRVGVRTVLLSTSGLVHDVDRAGDLHRYAGILGRPGAT
ncbi:MAG TPA: 2-phospho-L-lactate guanylyltransferase [Euzebyales bacterium]|nr:2-phospho-L-lactate guanylyltransferase [Euzebyales bacterium]